MTLSTGLCSEKHVLHLSYLIIFLTIFFRAFPFFALALVLVWEKFTTVRHLDGKLSFLSFFLLSTSTTLTDNNPYISSTTAAMAPKKSKKDANSINSRLALVMKSGKVTMGYKSTLKSLRSVRF